MKDKQPLDFTLNHGGTHLFVLSSDVTTQKESKDERNKVGNYGLLQGQMGLSQIVKRDRVIFISCNL